MAVLCEPIESARIASHVHGRLAFAPCYCCVLKKGREKTRETGEKQTPAGSTATMARSTQR